MKEILGKIGIAFVIQFIIATTAFSQPHSVSGTVIDNNDMPLPGVNVLLKGTSSGTSTDSEGYYELTAASPQDTLVFSFIGYQTQEIPIDGRTEINIVLQPQAITGEEMVVVGYGVESKSTVTGSITSTTNTELRRSPAASITNSLSGLLPGVTSLNRSGEPGAVASEIFIRGQSTTGDTSPLVVVDGVQNPSGWERINQNDIEDITILKDASAAIYGARAANGVILITTKRGSVGETTVDYSFNQGISQPTRTPEMANSALFAEYVNHMLVKDGQEPRYTDDEIQKFREGNDPNYPNTDWYEEVLKDYSLQSMHNLSVGGGSEEVQYSVSGSYTNQNSIFKKGTHEYNGYTLRSNLDAQVSENINLNLDVNAGLDNRNSPTASRDPFGMLKAIPMMPVYYPNGLPSAGIELGMNPAVMVTDASGNNNIRDQRFSVKAGFDIEVPRVQGLGVDGYFVYNNDKTLNKDWRTPWTVYNYDSDNDEYVPLQGGGITAPELTQSTDSRWGTFVNLRVTYEQDFQDHYINTFIGAEQSKSSNIFYSSHRRNFISQELPSLFAGDPDTQEAYGIESGSARQSLLGRFNYNFKEKYLLDVNLRYDGSHTFPEGNRFGFFPGVSVAWRLDGEDFLSGQESINDLKLRASYGKIGNDQIEPYQYLASYLLNSNGYHFGQTPTSTLGIEPGVTPNPNVTWEAVKTANIGLDGLFWDGLLGFSIDVFQQRRENILTKRNLEIPAYANLELPDENIGVVENKGIELEISHRNRTSGGNSLSYSISGNISFSKNNVIDVSEAQDVPNYQKAEGSILGAGLYYEALGIFRTQEEVDSNPVYPGTQVGDLQYRDVNEDGIIDNEDKVRMNKSNIPEITFGLNTSIGYKAFSLYANFAGQARAWQYYHQNARIAINGLEELIANRYTPGSMDSKYPILPTLSSPGGEPSGLESTFWLQNAAFLRLKTAEIAYTVPADLVSRINLSSVRIFLNGSNLFTLSEIKWFDPEGSNQRGDFYPQSKIFNLGIDISF